MASVKQTKARVAELRQALQEAVPSALARVGHAHASQLHRQLFDRYVSALRAAKADAEDWWQGLLDTETANIGDPVEAEVNVKIARPAGPAVSPVVVHAFREAFMECVRLNAQQPAASPVHPFELTMDWLLETGNESLAEFLGTLPFLPVAVDAQGQWA